MMPFFRQLFVSSPGGESGLELDRLAFCLRKRAEHEADVYFPRCRPGRSSTRACSPPARSSRSSPT
nr:hypothetical protein GCM10020093_116120 [Planobispora longispora]